MRGKNGHIEATTEDKQRKLKLGHKWVFSDTKLTSKLVKKGGFNTNKVNPTENPGGVGPDSSKLL